VLKKSEENSCWKKAQKKSTQQQRLLKAKKRAKEEIDAYIKKQKQKRYPHMKESERESKCPSPQQQ